MNILSIARLGLLFLAIGIVIYFIKAILALRRRRPWRIKGRGLRSASALVGKITPLPPPSATNEPGQDTQLRHYFLVNVTIQPIGGHSSVVPWKPSALRLVPAEHRYPDQPDDTGGDRYCRIESLDVMCGGVAFTSDDALTLAGPFDLRLRLAVWHDIRALKFRYYLEQFGAFPLPEPMPAMLGSDDLPVAPQLASANGS